MVDDYTKEEAEKELIEAGEDMMKRMKKAVRILPKQHDGYYALDNCKHNRGEETFKADDPYHGVSICTYCLAQIFFNKKVYEEMIGE